jgi:hypothetical protein
MKNYFGTEIKVGDVCMVVDRTYGYQFKKCSIVEVVGIHNIDDTARCIGNNRKSYCHHRKRDNWFLKSKKLVRIGEV